jgi:hypothetical protein
LCNLKYVETALWFNIRLLYKYIFTSIYDYINKCTSQYKTYFDTTYELWCYVSRKILLHICWQQISSINVKMGAVKINVCFKDYHLKRFTLIVASVFFYFAVNWIIILYIVVCTGEELLHEGWSSYNNLSGVLVITVTEFVGKLLYILQKHSSDLIIFIFLNFILCVKN